MKYLLPMFVLMACSTPSNQLTTEASKIEVFTNRPVGCRVAGRVVGVNKNGSKELALNHALNQAAEINATGIFVNQEVPNGSVMNVYATVYQCD
jgi:predicted RNA-binding protein (virulence factor B family)